jgi:recombinational DNA repair ATPase RecF
MISRLRARSFRALLDADLTLGDDITLVFGQNARGG